ncbi:MAG: hypothetical protein K5765_01215 [Clostridia bacterium]|nr:hypothetical protein [Clostridia bacterium]
MIIYDKKIRNSKKEYDKMLVNVERLRIELEEAEDYSSEQIEELEKKIQEAENEAEEYYQNVYARAIFEHFSPKKPDIINIVTKKTVKWDEKYPVEFDKLDKLSRSSLWSLVEDQGVLKIKK